jgi:hypothetical protein
MSPRAADATCIQGSFSPKVQGPSQDPARFIAIVALSEGTLVHGWCT